MAAWHTVCTLPQHYHHHTTTPQGHIVASSSQSAVFCVLSRDEICDKYSSLIISPLLLVGRCISSALLHCISVAEQYWGRGVDLYADRLIRGNIGYLLFRYQFIEQKDQLATTLTCMKYMSQFKIHNRKSIKLRAVSLQQLSYLFCLLAVSEL